MAKEKIRLGGMALPNGVLVHGPHSWACAIRHEDGRIEVASAAKPLQAARIKSPFLRGPARLAEAFALLPHSPISSAVFKPTLPPCMTGWPGSARPGGEFSATAPRPGRWHCCVTGG